MSLKQKGKGGCQPLENMCGPGTRINSTGPYHCIVNVDSVCNGDGLTWNKQKNDNGKCEIKKDYLTANCPPTSSCPPIASCPDMTEVVRRYEADIKTLEKLLTLPNEPWKME